MKPRVSGIVVVAAVHLGMTQAVGEGCPAGRSAGDCVRPRSPIDEVACPRASACKSKIGICAFNPIAVDQAGRCLGVIETQKDAVIAAYSAAMTMTDRVAMRRGLQPRNVSLSPGRRRTRC